MTKDDRKRADVELKTTYLEKAVEELSEVVIAQGRVLDDMAQRLARLEALASASAEGRPAPTDPLDERPPHY